MGHGHVTITLAPSGVVAGVVLDSGPFTGTVTAACIVARFETVRVPPFSGAAVRVGKSFSIH
jgi:hypothetical protein